MYFLLIEFALFDYICLFTKDTDYGKPDDDNKKETTHYKNNQFLY